MLNPAVVKQGVHSTRADGEYNLVPGLVVGRIVDCHERLLAGNIVEYRGVVGVVVDSFAVDFFDYASYGYVAVLAVKRPFFDNFVHFKTLSGIGPVVEQAEACRAVARR